MRIFPFTRFSLLVSRRSSLTRPAEVRFVATGSGRALSGLGPECVVGTSRDQLIHRARGAPLWLFKFPLSSDDSRVVCGGPQPVLGHPVETVRHLLPLIP